MIIEFRIYYYFTLAVLYYTRTRNNPMRHCSSGLKNEIVLASVVLCFLLLLPYQRKDSRGMSLCIKNMLVQNVNFRVRVME